MPRRRWSSLAALFVLLSVSVAAPLAAQSTCEPGSYRVTATPAQIVPPDAFRRGDLSSIMRLLGLVLVGSSAIGLVFARAERGAPAAVDRGTEKPA